LYKDLKEDFERVNVT